MHFVIEVIIPPTDDIAAAVESVLYPFREGCDDDEASSYQFFDWYVIGGRWAGNKLKARLGSERIQAFRDMLAEKGVTVSGFQAGKQTLEPASQIEIVDAAWRDMFPDSGFDKCPLFSHSNNQYSSEGTIPGDVCRLSQLPAGLMAEMVIIAGTRWSGEGFEARRINQKSFWNGCTHVDTTWDGLVATAISEHVNDMAKASDEYKAKYLPQPDWLVVTVDCHS